MTRPRVLVTRAIPPECLAELLAAPERPDVVVHPHDRPMTRAELLAGVPGCVAVLAQLMDRIDAEVLDAAGPGLRLVANYAVGTNNVELAAAAARGVRVSNTPGVLTESTADFTWALLLAVTRRVVEGDRVTRAGRFPGWSPLYMLGAEVAGSTLGVVGLGRIGAAVARRARAFGVRVLYAGPRPSPFAAEVGAERRPLDALLAEADVVSLHVPLDAGTHHLLDEVRLRRMKATAYLINVSRGPVVDEAALVRVLREGALAGAALDVYEREPALAPGLAELENVVLAPHLGSATRATRLAMGRLAVGNVLDVLAGRPPRTAL